MLAISCGENPAAVRRAWRLAGLRSYARRVGPLQLCRSRRRSGRFCGWGEYGLQNVGNVLWRKAGSREPVLKVISKVVKVRLLDIFRVLFLLRALFLLRILFLSRRNVYRLGQYNLQDAFSILWRKAGGHEPGPEVVSKFIKSWGIYTLSLLCGLILVSKPIGRRGKHDLQDALNVRRGEAYRCQAAPEGVLAIVGRRFCSLQRACVCCS